ncbi:ring finger domain-containing polycomb group component [Holotrichia oblita]|uniref:Ring finger domain-containing polycomb group component n=1 Tax=Holotrichia oblita TaxID=644536 RepID=A0ACB9SGT0_HOLOL|nr:ring finger domain-containing polycomb group component [Holotrichia oblita]
MTSIRSILLKDLNSILTCPLCSGYYIDATTLVDCMHSFCKSCILKHFENNKLICPTCSTACKRKENFSYYKSDMQLQTLVYKIVPGLYAKEIQRREDFYRTAGVRASSSCSDDSVIGDNMQEHEEWIHTLGDENQFLSPDDSISLSLEYYQQNLDTSSSPKKTEDRRISDSKDYSEDSVKSERNVENRESDQKLEVSDDKVQSDKSDSKSKDEQRLKDRRYLQCPAAVSMTHLQKFIRMKYALSSEHKVDIIHDGEVLPSSFTLMDVAYSFKWKRVKPMRFFYRIFTPMKIRPIRIINTSSTGQKQLQIVPVNSNPLQESKTQPPPLDSPTKKSPPRENTSNTTTTLVETEENSREKERLMAELQLQSKAKLLESLESQEKSQNSRYGKTYERNHDLNNILIGEKRKRDNDDKDKDDQFKEKRKKIEHNSQKIDKKPDQTEEEATCIFDYEEPDKEELKRFAEKRDREWQMIKHSDDEHRAYKKRKKNKHSKGEKRKLHAEITSELSNKQESIKLKVKLTPHNGHRHSKHNKTQNDGKNSTEMSSKEKLRQMRQIRHKLINSEEKSSNPPEEKPTVEQTKSEFTITLAKTTTETQTRKTEVEMKSSETQTKSSETQTISKDESKEKSEKLFSGKTLRSDFTIKTTASKEICNKQAIVQTERLDLSDRNLSKMIPRITYTKQDKPKSEVVEKKAQSTKSLQQQISKLHQQSLPKPKEIPKVETAKQEKKVTFSNDKPHILNTQYPSGFTVSKIEAGAKKKPELEDNNQDKRPSLEITLINPAPATEVTSTVTVPKQAISTTTKRPLPATIPLERIKSIKAVTTLSGISIIPKVSEKCDNIGALDLSKPHKSAETKIELNKNGLNPGGNGLKPLPGTTGTDKGPLSNLQMLSKVATEHPNINKSINVQNKPRQQMPSLQNIKVPNVQNQPGSKPANLAKIPKLNEITKGQFRISNSPRTMRPNQNQSIRNIPNPSLIVRQQNQNRMNSLIITQNSTEKEVKNCVSTMPEAEKKDEPKLVEKCNITVSKT